MSKLVPIEIITNKILELRGKRVMLDKDLARLYGVPTRRLNEQVKRNIKRFPDDFMFQLTEKEFNSLRSQIATSNRGGRRYTPYVFTEQGVAMLSGVLNSERAILVNIQIMRAFARLRGWFLAHRDVLRRVKAIEEQLGEHDKKIGLVFTAIRQLLEPPEPPEVERPKIGFRTHK
jgi:hypothetical protein